MLSSIDSSAGAVGEELFSDCFEDTELLIHSCFHQVSLLKKVALLGHGNDTQTQIGHEGEI